MNWSIGDQLSYPEAPLFFAIRRFKNYPAYQQAQGVLYYPAVA